MAAYIFRLKKFSPDTLPLERLGEYLLALADLIGNDVRVSFDRVNKGSAALKLQVYDEDTQIVEERLRLAPVAEIGSKSRKGFENIDSLLRKDGTSADFRPTKGATILKFPGGSAPIVQRIGPVWENGQLEGTVVSVGGKDDTKHIRLVGHDDEEYKLTTRSIELAKQLGNHLFSTVRVTGEGKWFRNENGKWELDNFYVQNCELLENVSLIEAIAALRDIDGDDWKTLPDPLATWQELRRG
jgi:hypothetical protein